MLELALHVLDLLENTLEAGAGRVSLTIDEDAVADRLTLCVVDDGRGIDPESALQVTNPFYTTRTTRHVGLGLPLLSAAAQQAGGGLKIRSHVGQGASVEATFQWSHLDRQPLGDLPATLLAFLLSPQAPELHYRHSVTAPGSGPAACSRAAFEFDTAEIRAELGDLSFGHPAVLHWLRGFLREGESSLCLD